MFMKYGIWSYIENHLYHRVTIFKYSFYNGTITEKDEQFHMAFKKKKINVKRT